MSTCSGTAAGAACAICACATCCACAVIAVSVRKDADPIRVAKRDVVGFMLFPLKNTGAYRALMSRGGVFDGRPTASEIGTPLGAEKLAQAPRGPLPDCHVIAPACRQNMASVSFLTPPTPFPEPHFAPPS